MIVIYYPEDRMFMMSSRDEMKSLIDFFRAM